MDENQKKETENVGHIVTADELVMDEATIIREQERLSKEKKKKAHAKRKKVLIILLVIILIGLTWYIGWGRKLFNKNAEQTVTISKKDNQMVTFVRVNTIFGNEMNVTLLKETEVSEQNAEQGDSGTSAEKGTGNAVPGGSMPEGFDGSSMPEGFGEGSMPEGFDGSSMPGGFGGGSMPEGFGGGSMPEGFDGSSMPGGFGGGSMPEGFDGSSMPEGFGGGSMPGGSSGGKSSRPGRGGSSDSSNGSSGNAGRSSSVLSYDNKTYELTDSKTTLQIPVGVTVTTKLGTETTFSRITAGDCLGLVTEVIDGEEVIIAVYIVG